MFTDDDMAFLDRLGARSQARLAGADPTREQLHAAISAMRASLHAASAESGTSLADELDDLLDGVWWAICAGDGARAREHAARLVHAVRDLDVSGLQSMRMVDAAQQIRSLVVLAA